MVWIYLKTASFETASEISKKMGNYTTTSESESNSYNRNQNGSSSESMNLISRQLLTEVEVLRIDYPNAIILINGDFPYLAKLPDLSKYRFNKILGLGNQKQNREIRVLREMGREQRNVKHMKL